MKGDQNRTTRAAERATECRHAFQCEGWTVDPRDSTCRVCGERFVFWSEPAGPGVWEGIEDGE